MRKYASSVLRALMAHYNTNIGQDTFYFWLTKFNVSEFDPIVKV